MPARITRFQPPAPPVPPSSAVAGGELPPRLIKFEEAAHRLGGVTVRHVENLVKRGKLRRKGCGKARGIVESSLIAYIEGEDDDG